MVMGAQEGVRSPDLMGVRSKAEMQAQEAAPGCRGCKRELGLCTGPWGGCSTVGLWLGELGTGHYPPVGGILNQGMWPWAVVLSVREVDVCRDASCVPCLCAITH